MSKRGTNDQQHIIDAIDRKDYGYVWEQVKFVGYIIVIVLDIPSHF